jgi:hypothetical protein
MARALHSLITFFILLILLPAGISSPVLAHAPLIAENNNNLGSATYIPDPAKSWAIYSELQMGGEAQYYRFDVRKGEWINVSLFTTTAPEDESFAPGLILTGPGIAENDLIPSFVETPFQAGTLVVQSARSPEATFEGFTPGVLVELAEISWEVPADGTYFIIVFDAERGGHYGLAVGYRESFTISEWILIPFSLLSIYIWERQNPLVVFAPTIAILIIGATLTFRHKEKTSLDIVGGITIAAGLLYLSTGATVFYQLLFALSQSSPDSFVAVTILLGIIPILLGIALLRLAFHHSHRWTVRSQMELFILAVLGIVSWSGYVIGPVLAGIAGILPSFVRKR